MEGVCSSSKAEIAIVNLNGSLRQRRIYAQCVSATSGAFCRVWKVKCNKAANSCVDLFFVYCSKIMYKDRRYMQALGRSKDNRFTFASYVRFCCRHTHTHSHIYRVRAFPACVCKQTRGQVECCLSLWHCSACAIVVLCERPAHLIRQHSMHNRKPVERDYANGKRVNNTYPRRGVGVGVFIAE